MVKEKTNTELSDEFIKEIVGRLAEGEFVNGEYFSPSQRGQILTEWRKHPNHPKNNK
ncbi:MAG: hypothetical protein M0P71_00670 [Melioribacteraceae bacterium]|nr:hypothetical protein [Melioribacteraceae bacterium]